MEECPCNMESSYKTASISDKDVASGTVKAKVSAPVSTETTLRPFYFPTMGITIMASSMEDALSKLEDTKKTK